MNMPNAIVRLAVVALMPFTLLTLACNESARVAGPTADPADNVAAEHDGAQQSASASSSESLATAGSDARYAALPPAFRTALDVYAWADVDPQLAAAAASDKIDQWGDNAIPLGELVGEERAGRFDNAQERSGLREVGYYELLGSYYVALLRREPDVQRRAERMSELVDLMAPPPPPDISDPNVNDIEEVSDSAPSVQGYSLPPLEAYVTPTALARIDSLGARMQAAVRMDPGTARLDDMAAVMTHFELFLLKAPAALDIPPIEQALAGAPLADYKALSAAARERADAEFLGAAFVQLFLNSGLASEGPVAESPPPHMLADVATWSVEWVSLAISGATESQ